MVAVLRQQAAASAMSYNCSEFITEIGFAGFALYLLARHVPSVEARHREERKEWITVVKEFRVSTDDLKGEIRDLKEQVNKLQG